MGGRVHFARGEFVGRADPLLLLDLWFRDALRGEPRLVLVTGDAGIGKSRLVDEWLRRAEDRSIRILAGSAYEDVATPYLAIASAVTDLPGMSELFTTYRATAEADTGELQLYLSVPKAILGAASSRPTVLVLNDMQWADQGTLELLGQVVACASHPGPGISPRLLILVTGRAHGGGARWQQSLRRLPLEALTRTLPIGGLDELEVNELLDVLAGAPPAKQLLRSVFEATEGNPLLIHVLLDRLDAHSLLEVRGGRLIATTAVDRLAVAADLEEAWAARLDKIGPSGRFALVLAALLGDGGRLSDLQVVTALDEDSLAEILEQARSAELLSEDGGTYHFDHPHLRRALVSSMAVNRREQLEALIAERLLEANNDGETRTLAIVQHLRRAGRSADVSRQLALLAPVAAEQANSLSAWALAACYYEDALAATDTASALDRAVLHLRAGQAHHRNHDFAAAVPHHLEAIALAQQEGDLRLWGEALFWLGGVGALQRTDGGHFDEHLVNDFLTSAGEDLPNERALVLAYVAEHHFGQLAPAAGLPAINAAEALCQAGVRPATRHFVSHIHGTIRLGCLDLPNAQKSFEAALALNAQHDDPWQAVWVEVGAPLVGVVAGRLEESDAQAARAVKSSYASQQWDLHGLGLALRAAVAVAQGRAHDGVRHAVQAVQSYYRSDFFYAGAIAFPHLAAVRAYLGDGEGARRALRQWHAHVGGFALGHALLVEVHVGDLDELRRLAKGFRPLSLPSEPTLFTLHTALVAIEVGDRLDELDWVEAGFTHLRRAHDLGVEYTLEWATCVARALAQAAIRLDRFEEAARFIDLADAAATTARSPLDRARTEICRARLALASGDTHGGIGHLQTALGYLEPANLLSFCHEVHRLAPEGALALRRELVLLYTDIVGSTQLNVSMGDQLFLEMLRQHNRIVRQRLALFGGVEFTYTGDGVGARFSSVDSALGFALGLQDEFDEDNRSHMEFPLHVRVGLARGNALEEQGNLFGQTVVRAVRICAQAGAGEVCVGNEIASVADPVAFRFHRLGAFPLKGFGGAHELFEAERVDTVVGPSSLGVTN